MLFGSELRGGGGKKTARRNAPDLREVLTVVGSPGTEPRPGYGWVRLPGGGGKGCSVEGGEASACVARWGGLVERRKTTT
ncbi:hypothetical protein E2562_013294 [Oryza meyeriana var. granulata]|uniref:Uncharacterized protein n=1 Tax=Oryza meyeriana var. granulata TaxID=110450 RepID=A0A6G1D2J2_9ORYZ|nr:hypothetical protein E2562_013294 [Oryza meyeriana var. granulata]